jgi:hypothetical protein
MAETANIAKMAEKISNDIFSIFLWDKKGPMNQNWICKKQEEHKKDTHPSDVVFFYDEPYRDVRTYVQTDLKSYQAQSIARSKIESALISLSQQIACAESSEQYQATYTHQHKNFEIVGLLFIYNHDGGYDRAFDDVLKSIKTNEIRIPKDRRIFILGPKDIHWINNVSHDIQWLRGRSGSSKLPDEDYCSYFYPQGVGSRQVRGEERCAAILETLTGPWIILKYGVPKKGISGFVIYYRNSHASVDEFLYFIDFMRRYGILDENHKVQIRYIEDGGANATNFQSAQQQYAEQVAWSLEGPGTLATAVRSIEIDPINNVISMFSEEQIGMEYDR